MWRAHLAMGVGGRAVTEVRVDDLVLSDLTLGELARLYRRLADHIASDEATSFTDDGLFVATSKLSEAAAAKVLAASYIRGTRKGSPEATPRRRRCRSR